MVKVWWQGDENRAQQVDGSYLATLALERYVRLHVVGYSEEVIAGELWFMATHFRFKTGCAVYFPRLREPSHPMVKAGKHALSMGQGVLANLISKLIGV